MTSRGVILSFELGLKLKIQSSHQPAALTALTAAIPTGR